MEYPKVWSDFDLESYREEDFEWYQIKEEALLFNEPYFCSKYLQDKTDGEDQIKQEEHKESNFLLNFFETVESQTSEQRDQSIQHWTKKLTEICSNPLLSSSSFKSIFEKKIQVQGNLYNSFQRSKARNQKKNEKKVDIKKTPIKTLSSNISDPSSVPVVVRMGILTMFPLIEAMSTIPGANFAELCSKTLDVLQSVLSSLFPFSLHKEPEDCLNAFQNFIHSLLERENFVVTSESQTKIVEALIGLALARGNPQYMLSTINALLQIYKEGTNFPIRVGRFLKQSTEYNSDVDVTALFENARMDSFVLNFIPSSEPRNSGSGLSSTSEYPICTDGSFLYFYNSTHGLVKVGTGFKETIEGHAYAINENFCGEVSSTRKVRSLLHISNKLYFYCSKEEKENNNINNPENEIRNNNEDLSSRSRSSSELEEADILELEDQRILDEARAQGIHVPAELLESVRRGSYRMSEGRGFRAPPAAASYGGLNPPISINPPLNNRSSNDSSLDQGTSVFEFLVLNNEDLIEEKSYQIKSPVKIKNCDHPFTSDGRYIYLITKVDGKKKEASSDNTPKEIYILEIYDPLVTTDDKEFLHIKSVELGHPEGYNLLSIHGIVPEVPGQIQSSFTPQFYEKGSFYCTGHQFSVIASPEIWGGGSSGIDFMQRIFDVTTGKHICDVLIRSSLGSLCVCFDYKNNMIWNYSPNTNRLVSWTNTGPSPKFNFLKRENIKQNSIQDNNKNIIEEINVDNMEEDEPPKICEESILNLDEKFEFTVSFMKDSSELKLKEFMELYVNSDKNQIDTDIDFDLKPLPIILNLISNMNRLVRQYENSSVLDENKQFSVILDSKVLYGIHEILLDCIKISDSFSGKQEDNIESEKKDMIFVMLSCLRIMNSTITEITREEKTLNNLLKDSQNQDLLNNLKNLLLNFINNDNLPKSIQFQSSNILLEGIDIFYQKSTEKLDFCIESLESFIKENQNQNIFSKNSSKINFLVSTLSILNDRNIISLDLFDQENSVDAENLGKDNAMEIDFDFFEKKHENFIFSLLEVSILETVRRLNNLFEVDEKKDVDSKDSSILTPLISVSQQLLLSIQRDVSHDPKYSDLFLNYSLKVIEKSKLFLNDLPQFKKKIPLDNLKISKKFNNILKNSFLSVILPSLCLILSRKDYFQNSVKSVNILENLIELISPLDSFSNLFSDVFTSDIKYMESTSNKNSKSLVVESKHPYPSGQYQFKQTVTIPNAKSLCIYFDKRCKTANSNNDVLQIFNSINSSQNISKSNDLNDSNSFVFSGPTWPKQPIVIKGDSVTFLFSTTSKQEKNANMKYRWGFMCTVTELSNNDNNLVLDSWLLNLENSLAGVCSKIIAALIEGEKLSNLEKKYSKWLKLIFNGGIYNPENNVEQNLDPFLSEILNSTGDGEIFFKFIQNLKNKNQILPSVKDSIEKVDRYVISSMILHSGLINEAKNSVSELNLNENLNLKEKFQFIASNISNITKHITLRGQIFKEWNVMISDDEKIKEKLFLKRYSGNFERLQILCENFEIQYLNNNDEIKILNLLYQKFEFLYEKYHSNLKNKENFEEKINNTYQSEAEIIIQKSILLLKTKPDPKIIIPKPSIEEINPFSLSFEKNQDSDSDSDSDLNLENKDSKFSSQSLNFEKLVKNSIPRSNSIDNIEKNKNHDSDLKKRVSELRNWVNGYNSWNSKKEEIFYSDSKSIFQNITNYLTELINPESIENIIKVHEIRAETRYSGIKALSKLLSLVTFGSVRHQILGCMVHLPLCSGSHYLDNIESSSHFQISNVMHEFGKLFDQIMNILKDSNSDLSSRLLALNICGLKFKVFDAELLKSTKILPLLKKIMILNIDENFLSKYESILSTELKEKEEELTIEKQKYKKNFMKKHKNFQYSAWTAFQLLSSQCISWNSESEKLFLDKSTLTELQDQIFEIICSELKRVSESMNLNESKNQNLDKICYDLLSLLILFNGTETGKKSLSNEENIKNLLSILNTNTSLRSKRIVLRLCRQFLTKFDQDSKAVDSLVQFFLDSIGKSFFDEKLLQQDVSIQIQNSDCLENQDDENSMEVDSNNKDIEEKENVNQNQPSNQYGLYLVSWNMGHRRLIEVCVSSLGQDFFMSGSSSFLYRRQNTESKARQIIQSLEHGKVLLKKTSQEECLKIAKILTEVGATVCIDKYDEVEIQNLDNSGKKNQNKNKQRFDYFEKYSISPNLKKTHGHSSQSLASEYISVLRHLLLGENLLFKNSIINSVYDSIKKIPHLLELEKFDTDSFIEIQRAIASQAIMGGFSEKIRVGGSVQVLVKNLKEKGTVVDFTFGKKTANILLSSSNQNKEPQKFEINQIKPVPEIQVTGEIFPPNSELLPSFLTCFLSEEQTDSLLSEKDEKLKDNENEENLSKLLEWSKIEMKSKSIKVMNHLISNSEEWTLLFIDSTKQKFTEILTLANSCNSSEKIENLELQSLNLTEKLWDLKTPFYDDTSKSNMSEILKNFEYSSDVDLLPTCFLTSKLQGVITRGNSNRIVEYSGFGIGRRVNQANQEILFLGNAIIPYQNLPLYYFEISVESGDSQSIVSIGFSPEGAKNWGNNSYKYQANGKKTHYENGVRKLVDYGQFFKSKCIIGALWDVKEKTISFTKDGKNLGIAFRNTQMNAKSVPCVGLGRSVRIKVNFGQDPFLYEINPKKPEEDPNEDPKIKEERLKKEQEKLEKERTEQEEKLKKEKEDENAAKMEAAEPLLAMGYDLKQCLRALEATGFSGAEAAAMWLLENPDLFLVDSDKEDKEDSSEKAEKKDESPEIKEEKNSENIKKSGELSKSSDNLKKSQTLEKENSNDFVEKIKQPIDKYNARKSSNYVLSDNYRFSDFNDVLNQKSESSEWEDSIIPEIRQFMEQDGFSNFEVEEYLQQIRNHLSTSNEAQAKAIVQRIMADAAANIRFPDAASSNQDSVNVLTPPVLPLKIDEIHIGSLVTFSKELFSNDDSFSQNWIDDMESTFNLSGVVKFVNQKDNLVLVQFFNSELSNISEWWYSIKSLTKPKNSFILSNIGLTDFNQVSDFIVENEFEILKRYCRKLILSLLKYYPLNISNLIQDSDSMEIDNDNSVKRNDNLKIDKFSKENSPLNLYSILSLIGDEYFSNLKKQNFKNTKFFNQKLNDLYKSENEQDLNKLILDQILTLFLESQLFSSENCINFTDENPNYEKPKIIEIKNSTQIFVNFDKQNSYLIPKSKFYIFEDFHCSKLITIFSETSNFSPLEITKNKFFIKLTSEGNKKGSIIKFLAIPSNSKFGLACYLTEFLIKKQLKISNNLNKKSFENINQLFENIFTCLIDFIYTIDPCKLKQTIFTLLNKLLITWSKIIQNYNENKVSKKKNINSEKPLKNWIPIEKLIKLKEEMTILQINEKKKETSLISSYLQDLITLLTTVKKIQGISNQKKLKKKQENEALIESEKKKEEIETKKTGDENLSVAIALAKSFSETITENEKSNSKKDTESGKEPEKREELEKKEENKESDNIPIEQEEKKEEPEKEKEENKPEIESGNEKNVDLFEDEYMDDSYSDEESLYGDDFSAAIALSLADQSKKDDTESVKEDPPKEVPTDDEHPKKEDEAEVKKEDESEVKKEDESEVKKGNNDDPKQNESESEKSISQMENALNSSLEKLNESFFGNEEDSEFEAAMKLSLSSVGIQAEPEKKDQDSGKDEEPKKDDSKKDDLNEDHLKEDYISEEEDFFESGSSQDNDLFGSESDSSSSKESLPPNLNTNSPKRSPKAAPKSIAGYFSSNSDSSYSSRWGSRDSQKDVSSKKPAGFGSKLRESSKNINSALNKNQNPENQNLGSFNDKFPLWFRQYLTVSQIIDYFTKDFIIKDHFNQFIGNKKQEKLFLKQLIKLIFPDILSENSSIKDRIIFIENLPQIDIENIKELKEILKITVTEFGNSKIDNSQDKIHIGLTENEKNIQDSVNKTENWCFIELLNPNQINECLKKLNNFKFKSKFNSDKPNLLKVHKYNDIENNQEFETKVSQYLISQLTTKNSKTNENELNLKYKNVLIQIFKRFSKNNFMTESQLNSLQKVITSEKLEKEKIDFIFEKYESTFIDIVPDSDSMEVDSDLKENKQERAITETGFLQLYLEQSVVDSIYTFTELEKFGYDFHLEKNSFDKKKEALKYLLNNNWNLNALFQYNDYIEYLCLNSEISSALVLPLNFISEINLPSFPLLADKKTEELRLVFMIIKYFNQSLASSLPFINITKDKRLEKCRDLIFHKTKMNFIYEILDKTSNLNTQPSVYIDRLKLAAKKENKNFDITLPNNNIFGISFQQLKKISPILLRRQKPGGTDPHFSIKVVFKNENVEGFGGPYRHFFTTLCSELKSLTLFIPVPNSQHKIGDGRDKYIPNPNQDSNQNLSMFRYFGRLMGIAIRTGVIMSVDFPSFFWKQLVNDKLNIQDLKKIDTSFVSNLEDLRNCTDSDFSGKNRKIFDKFIVTLSDNTKIILKKNGENINVTKENVEEFINLSIKKRLNESYRQIQYIKKGLTEIIPKVLLNILSWNDLEWKVAGKPYVDISLLKRHTEYAQKISHESQHIIYFWQVLSEFSQVELRKFLRFAWGQERLPADDQEFHRTQTRMLIKPSPLSGDANTHFPTADTCFFNLMLPEYTSLHCTRQQLTTAINLDADSMDADAPQSEDGPENIFDYSDSESE